MDDLPLHVKLERIVRYLCVHFNVEIFFYVKNLVHLAQCIYLKCTLYFRGSALSWKSEDSMGLAIDPCIIATETAFGDLGEPNVVATDDDQEYRQSSSQLGNTLE